MFVLLELSFATVLLMSLDKKVLPLLFIQLCVFVNIFDSLPRSVLGDPPPSAVGVASSSVLGVCFPTILHCLLLLCFGWRWYVVRLFVGKCCSVYLLHLFYLPQMTAGLGYF